MHKEECNMKELLEKVIINNNKLEFHYILTKNKKKTITIPMAELFKKEINGKKRLL